MEKRTRNAQDKEFDNFEELARKLLAVPKKELDKQRAAYQEEKKGKSTKPAE